MTTITDPQRRLLRRLAAEDEVVSVSIGFGAVASFRLGLDAVHWATVLACVTRGWLAPTRDGLDHRLTGRYLLTARGRRAVELTNGENDGT